MVQYMDVITPYNSLLNDVKHALNTNEIVSLVS